MKWFSFPRFLRRGNGKKAPSQPEKAVETAHQPEDENARSEKLPAPEKGRGPITHCDLASLSSLTLPFENDPFFRLRPPPFLSTEIMFPKRRRSCRWSWPR